MSSEAGAPGWPCASFLRGPCLAAPSHRGQSAGESVAQALRRREGRLQQSQVRARRRVCPDAEDRRRTGTRRAFCSRLPFCFCGHTRQGLNSGKTGATTSAREALRLARSEEREMKTASLASELTSPTPGPRAAGRIPSHPQLLGVGLQRVTKKRRLDPSREPGAYGF